MVGGVIENGEEGGEAGEGGEGGGAKQPAMSVTYNTSPP